MLRQTRAVRDYRIVLEDLVTQVKGTVSMTDAHLIDEACQAQMHCDVCRWIMREKLETMSVSDITKCSEQQLKAKTSRNKAIRQLGLDVPPEPLDLRDYIDGRVAS